MTTALQVVERVAHPERADAIRSGPDAALASAYALGLVGFPLISTLPLAINADSTVATVPFRALVVLLTVVILARWLLLRHTPVLGGRFVAVTFVLWTLLIARMLWDTYLDPLQRPTLPEAPQFVALSIGSCFVPALAFLQYPAAETLRWAAGLVQSLGTVATVLLAWFGVQTLATGAILQRLSTEVLNPIAVGHLGTTVFIVAACQMLHARRRGSLDNIAVRFGRWLALVAGFGAAIASFSRAPITALVFAIGALVWVHPGFSPSRGKRVVFGVAAASVVIFVVSAVVLYLEENALLNTLWRLSEGLADESALERIDMFRGAWTQFADHPLAGSAFVELRWMTYPHNMILETMMATGIVGLSLLLICVAVGSVAAWRIVCRADDATWVGLLYIQYLSAQLASGSVLLAGTFWALSFAVCALYQGRARHGQHSMRTT